MLLKKSSTLLSNELLELILVIMFLAAIIFFYFQIISPQLDKNKEIAESFMNTLNKQIEAADKGGTGEFAFWGIDPKLDIYLVYFGDFKRVVGYGKSFILPISGANSICVCIAEDENKGSCLSCTSLNFPATLGGLEDHFVIEKNMRVSIKKENGKYVFEVK